MKSIFILIFILPFSCFAQGIADNSVQTRIQTQSDIDRFFVSNEGRYFATAGGISPEYFTLWDAQSMRQIRDIPCELPSTEDRWQIRISEKHGKIGAICKLRDDSVSEYGSHDGLKIVDLVTGQKISQSAGLAYGEEVLDFSFHHGVYLGYHSDGISKYDLDSHTRMDSLFIDESSLNRAVVDEKSGMIFGVNHLEFVEIRLDDFEITQRLPLNQEQRYVIKFEVSPDNKKLYVLYPPGKSPGWSDEHQALIEYSDTLEVYNIETNDLLISEPFHSPEDELIFSSDSESLLYFGYSEVLNEDGTNKKNITERSLADDTLKEHYIFSSIESSVLSRFDEQNRLIISTESNPQIFNLSLDLLEREAPTGIDKEYTSISVIDKGKQLIVRSGQAMHSINHENPAGYEVTSHSGSLVFIQAGNGWWIADNPDNYTEDEEDYWMTYEFYHPERIRNPITIELKNTYITHARILDNLRVLIGSQNYNTNVASYKILSLETGETLSEYSFSIDHSRMSLFDYIPLSADLNYVAAFKENESYDYIEIIDVSNDLKPVLTIPNGRNLLWTNDPNEFAVLLHNENEYRSNEYYLYSMETPDEPRFLGSAFHWGNSIQIQAIGRKLYSFGGNRIEIYDMDGNSEPELLGNPISDYLEVTYDADSGKLGFVQYNQILWVDPYSFTEYYRAIVSSEKGVTIVMPDGEYFAWSGDVPDHVNFVHSARAYSFEEFDLLFNRPDKVLDRLGYADQPLIDLYHSAYRKRLSFHGNRIPIMGESLPVVQLDRIVISIS